LLETNKLYARRIACRWSRGCGRRCVGGVGGKSRRSSQLPASLTCPSTPQLQVSHLHTAHHEVVLGLRRLINVLHSFCSSPVRQPRNSASYHRPAAGPVAIPLDRARRRRDNSTHQRIRRKTAKAIRRRRCRQIKSAFAGVGRGRGAR
jgi:hypothetical protein